MSTELSLLNPTTGEALSLESPTEDLGRWLGDVREFEADLRDAKNAVQAEIIRRADQQAKWTLRPGNGIELVTQSPRPQEDWNGADLRAALLEFVDAGVLSIEAVDAAVSTSVEFKVHRRGIESLRALGGDVAKVINRLVTRSEPRRYVKVGRL